ncbi:hypothetical protein B6R96_34065 [Streptomyces sp. Sge12]|uniref:hypothetical protein n=1 Tax=Streptomyces sp. Sge12 TaxID=1972846 RepID=UPI0009C2A6C6|nr:hypothetical protein [Streptomyces sp. Sge12]ARE78352.1 hypothetical protein B6R96_34065 [Streptomyces sp. Sge12]
MKSPSAQPSLRHDAEAEARRTPAPAPEGRRGEGAPIPPWKERPYVGRGDEELAGTIAACLAETKRYEEKAAQAREGHGALRVRLEQDLAQGATRGGRWAQEAGAVLDSAITHLTTAIEAAGRARQADEQATQARRILPGIARQLESSWIALRLAGSSNAEVSKLREHYLDMTLPSAVPAALVRWCVTATAGSVALYQWYRCSRHPDVSNNRTVAGSSAPPIAGPRSLPRPRPREADVSVVWVWGT